MIETEPEPLKPPPAPKGTMLRYSGPSIHPGDGAGLPQGWPAGDHDEPDNDLRKAKLASGNYAVAGPDHEVRSHRGLET